MKMREEFRNIFFEMGYIGQYFVLTSQIRRNAYEYLC
jgi:hypothetical protein